MRRQIVVPARKCSGMTIAVSGTHGGVRFCTNGTSCSYLLFSGLSGLHHQFIYHVTSEYCVPANMSCGQWRPTGQPPWHLAAVLFVCAVAADRRDGGPTHDAHPATARWYGAIDVSPSMRATDVSPGRLVAAESGRQVPATS